MSRLKSFFLISLCLSGIKSWGQSNLLINPSFEKAGWNPISRTCILNDLPDWEFGPNGADRCPAAAPHGNVVVAFYPYLAQNVPTVPGRSYYLKVASQGPIGASFDDQVVNTLTNIGGTNYIFNQPWFYSYCHFSATGNVSRLSLLSTNMIKVDDLLLGWLDEPITLVRPPSDTEVPLGGRVTLQVEAQGGPPLFYQWFKDSVPIAGANGPVYFVTNGLPELAGQYEVAVSNHVGVITSDPVRLTVDETPQAPRVTFQPEGFSLIAGSSVTLRSAASGTPPLRFQWRANGTNLPGETNTIIKFAPLAPEHAGVYDVTVENDTGSTVSLPATVTVRTNARVGILAFVGNVLPPFRRPCFDVDGITPLFGPAYRCQVYAGETPEQMAAVGFSQEFRTNSSLAGLPNNFSPFWITFTDSSSDWTVYYQLRAWESAFGASYEEARSLGGKVGASALLTTVVLPPEIPPSYNIVLPGLTLRAGLPGFTTGRIEKGVTTADGLIEWQLIGARGFTYLIERRQPPNTWLPFTVLSNATGTVTFTDPDQPNRSSSFYRGRMLD